MKDDTELRALVVGLLERQLRTEDHGGSVTPRTSLGDGGLELTSLQLVRLLVDIEEQLDIELADVAIMNANFDTVDDIVAVVGSSMSPGGVEANAGRP